ncbi:dynein axonemal assembly factor 10 [Arctopsyche grandis]|uniref:dynein axonemal assembly factor 10 n=1 Tax=Arctopsyche grandis TaxID=121162 RepID=UPI00406D7A1C
MVDFYDLQTEIVRKCCYGNQSNKCQVSTMEGMRMPQVLIHSELNLNHSLFDCRWVPLSTKLVVVGAQPRGCGSLRLFEVKEGTLQPSRQREHPNALKCCTFGASSHTSRQLATGDFQGNLDIWDLEDLSTVYSAKDHKDMINCIDGIGGNANNCGAPEIVTGSRDGTVKVWDQRQKEKPVANMEPYPGETKRDCWTVAFGNSYNNTERIVCAGYDNGDLKMFDLRTMSLRWECNLKNGVCSVEFDRRDIPMNKLVATTLEGKFHVFDLRTQHHQKGFAQVVESEQNNGTVWLCRHLPQNRELFMTCAGTGHLLLWQYSYPDKRHKKDGDGEMCGVAGSLVRLQKMAISTQPVNSLDWCPDKLGLAVCTSFDQHLRIVITTKLKLYS